MLRKLTKIVIYAMASLIILLAVAVGLLRILMPQLPQYQEQISARVSAAIDGDVTFARMDARWRLRGPELVFYEVVIGERVGGQTIVPLEIDVVTVGLSVSDLVLSQSLQVRRIGVQGSRIALTRAADGWTIQALPVAGAPAEGAPPEGTARDDTPPAGGAPETGTSGGFDFAAISPLEVRLEDVNVQYDDARTRRGAVDVRVDDARLSLTDDAVLLDASLRHEAATTMQTDLRVTGSVDGLALDQLVAGDWTVSADISDLSATLARTLLPDHWRLPLAGEADLLADLRWRGATVEAAVLELDADSLIPADGNRQSEVSGRVEWSRTDGGWVAALSEFVVGVSDRRWPAAAVRVSSTTANARTRVSFDGANITVYDLPYLASFLPEDWAASLRETGAGGTLLTTSGTITMAAMDADTGWALDAVSDYDISATFEALSLAPVGPLPGFANLSGEMNVATESGRLDLDSTDASVTLPALFAGPIALTELDGTIIWRRNDRGMSIISNAITLATANLATQSSLELLLPGSDSAPVIDLRSSWSLDDIAEIDDLLPTRVISPKLREWLNGALQAGRIRNGRLTLTGDLSRFPFTDGGGEFSASAEAEGVVMRYARQWPTLTDVSATVALDGLTLSTRENAGLSGSIPFSDSLVVFDDLRSGVLRIENGGRASLQDMYRYAADSPLRGLFGNAFDKIRVAGDAAFTIDLTVPLKALPEFAVDARFETDNGAFALDGLPFDITAITGVVDVSRAGVVANELRGKALGADVTMRLAPTPESATHGLEFGMQGTLTSAALVESLAPLLAGRVDGETAYELIAALPRRNLPEPSYVRVLATSELSGLALELPFPLGKPAAGITDVEAELVLSPTLTLRADWADSFDLVALFDRDAATGRLAFERGTVNAGRSRALLPLVPGLFVDGDIDRVRLGDWLALRGPEPGFVSRELRQITLGIDDLYAFGQHVRDVDVNLQTGPERWLVDVNAATIVGNIILPTPPSTAPVILDMQRLHLRETDPLPGPAADPTRVPALRISADSFELGQRRFGALSAVISKTDNGLSIEQITTEAPSFVVRGAGTWLLDPVEPLGSRTAMQADVSSTDVKAMMDSLGYQPGINADVLQARLDVSWGGGPREDFVATLDGDVSVQISNGTLDDVEPGAGRVVGLMSIAELPRRLALDFRDVFRKGFSFDDIDGDFRIVNGDAFTCNLSMQGSSADVGIIGRASLDRRNYNQTAVVSVKVGNTLPAVGAVVGGPQVGAALLIFSQIFKKPLQGMTEVFYQINGGWDEPSIERTDSARFAATAELAGCLVDDGS